MAAVARSRSILRDLCATFCVAIALLYAGATAGSVVDGAQHAAKAPHEHHVSLTAMGDDHHHGHGQDGHHQQGDDDADDIQTGPGHHHSEPPAVALTSLDAPIHVTPALVLTRSAPSASKVEGLQPGGLERPPRTTVIDV